MCGLAAIMACAGAPVDPAALNRIRDAMAKRGPDGHGTWLAGNGGVGLAHRRLSIIDTTDAAAQPMASADGRHVIAFNGEIYNYRALRAGLERDGAVFRSDSDTEVLLQLYRRDGIAMLDRLRGMFAFALWDDDKGGMLLARDHFGIKPLYVADDGKTLRAASQVKALLAGGGIDTSPDPAGHAGFFLWGHVPEPHTLYRGIRALPPGTWLWAEADGTRRPGRFFDLSGELAAARGRDAADAAELTREALLDSVRHHLIADVPVGLFLSGGIDSTTLAALATESLDTPLRTVTLGFSEFGGTERDEAPLAEAVAAHYRTDHHTDRITAAQFAEAKAQILSDMDQPSIDGINTWFVARAAHQHGLKVALSGLGGDELFAGYDSFRQVPALSRRLAPFRAAPLLGVTARLVTAPWIGALTSPKWAGLLEYATTIGGAWMLRRGLFMPWELDRVMDPDMAADGLAGLATVETLGRSVAAIASNRLKITALETGRYMQNQLLRDADWAAMAHSLEIRTPLVDVDLFRRIIPLTLGDNPPGKATLARAARPALPPEITNRRKTGFFIPVEKWLGYDSLRDWSKYLYSNFEP